MSISVAMAAYNGSTYIKEQIASIMPQLGQADELIISCDPSVDKTWDIICEQSQTDPRIKVYRGPGKGLILNFQKAIESCHGDYIFLCDQDDIWCPNKVKYMVECFSNTNADVILHDACIVNQDLVCLQPSYFEFHNTGGGYWRNIIKNGFIGCCMAFKRSFRTLIIPFPPNIPMHDQWIGLLGLKYGKVVFLRKQLIYYRRHSSNATFSHHASVLQMLKWRVNILLALGERARTLK
ncbi:glycosyltransferase [Oscillospiraceae bacterium HV4-5-C5C]|nr:glycosyltransferase [Oscillospiraceae bacterium HV4-5-C5C]